MKNLKIIFILFFICMLLSVPIYGITNNSSNILNGIDVSNWQGYIDYEKVRKDGIDVVYIESSIGKDYIDPYFELNYENAKLNGLKVGVYHFLTARSITEAEQEAEFFVSVISGKKIDCKLAMDFEEFGDLNVEQINDISEAFLNKVIELTGKETIVYSDLSNAENVFDLSNIASLWLAYYGSDRSLGNIESAWKTSQGRQYTDMGKVNGINGYVDRDFFTADVLLNDNSEIKRMNMQVNSNSERITYIVKPENTLWQIAEEYNVTINELININNITNPDLIYPGEKLSFISNTNFNQLKGLGQIFYTIKPGDTLSQLAVKYNTTIYEIAQKNDIKNVNIIYVGQRIRI